MSLPSRGDMVFLAEGRALRAQSRLHDAIKRETSILGVSHRPKRG